MASSTSGGVFADDDEREGEKGKKENSGSKFRNSVQSQSKMGGVGGNRSSCGISNKGKSSIVVGMPKGGSSSCGVSVINVGCLCMSSPVTEGTMGEGRDGALKKSRSNEDDSSGSVEAGFGSWKV